MDRRTFIKLVSSLGLAAYLTPLRCVNAAVQSSNYYIFISADGGWDPTSVCDPKGDILYDDNKGVINTYPVSAIRQAGNIRFSPLLDPSYGGEDYMERFFNEQFNDLRVFNGIDHETNSHAVGVRMSTSGNVSPRYPVLPAFMAAQYKSLMMPYYLGGGNGTTGDLVNATRINEVGDLEKLNTSNPYLPNEVIALIESHNEINLSELLEGSVPGAKRNSINEFINAHSSSNELNLLFDYLPSEISNGVKGQAEIAAASLAAGLSISCSLNVTGFDTHGNHDVQHNLALMDYFDLLNHVIGELYRLNLEERTTLILGSDFGRTPWYNSNSGKDHWNTGSIMTWSKSIEGNRVIGGTTNKFTPLKVNPDTLDIDDNGIILTPAHFHKAMRKREGLLETDNDRKFPLSGEILDLLS